VFPLEYAIEAVLHPLKGLIAHELSRSGFSQNKIGLILGVSQPAVSAYLKTPRETYLERLRRAGLEEREVGSLLEVVTTALRAEKYADAINYVNGFVITALSSLKLCEYHKAIAPVLKDCDVCKYLALADEVHRRVKFAYELLRNCDKCARLVPKILMNIVELGAGGAVGFPGRIGVESGVLTARGEPRIWGSKFLGRLIAEVNKLRPRLKSVVNIAYGQRVVECARGMFEVEVVGPSNDEDEIIRNILEAFRRGEYDVIFDVGGHGIEPNGYVFGSDAADAAIKVIRISDCIE